MILLIFFRHWAPRFTNCSSLGELDEILNSCSLDWLRSLQNNEKTPQKEPENRHRPERPKRSQTRQLQREKNRKKKDHLAKSRIQQLYSRYPRRAIRKILQEDSQCYTGSREDAEAFLLDTYSKPRPSISEISAARSAYDSCKWASPAESDMQLLSSPPKLTEIRLKLQRATNTAPGKDGIEYQHLRSLDPNGRLLEIIFKAVWAYGIPSSWKTSRTVPIYKKGDSTKYENFRPISLLPTMYKIFSGILNTRLLNVATSLGWISAEQKGFLPGVRGIQEHTHLLQAARDEATRLKKDLVITWLDLTNAFGSIPHAILDELFKSLPIPEILRKVFSDIYSRNVMEFVVGKETVVIHPTAGVRQGDPLSTGVFNLAAEPILRAAKSICNNGFAAFGTTIKATAYADDIAAVGSTTTRQQVVIDEIDSAAATLQLKFNPSKCVSLILLKGKIPSNEGPSLLIRGLPIRKLNPEENEEYLGTPMGSKLLFRLPNTLAEKLNKVSDSDLAPWQKLEVFRSALLPSVSHHLASGKVEKGPLYDLDVACRDFLRRTANAPIPTNTAFFYADRRIGGLGAQSISQEADIWTIARAVQLLDSKDEITRNIASAQLDQSIKEGLGRNAPSVLPYGEFLSGSMDKGLIALSHGRSHRNLWT